MNGNVSCMTSSLYLTQNGQDLTVDVYVNQEDVHFDLCTVDAQKTECIPIHFTAIEVININTDEITTPTDVPSDKGKGYHLDFLGGLGLPQWLSITLDIVIIIVAIIILAILFYVLLKTIWYCCRKKDKTQ